MLLGAKQRSRPKSYRLAKQKLTLKCHDANKVEAPIWAVGKARHLGFRLLGLRLLGLRLLGFWLLGFRLLGFRLLGFRLLGFWLLGFRLSVSEAAASALAPRCGRLAPHGQLPYRDAPYGQSPY